MTQAHASNAGQISQETSAISNPTPPSPFQRPPAGCILPGWRESWQAKGGAHLTMLMRRRKRSRVERAEVGWLGGGQAVAAMQYVRSRSMRCVSAKGSSPVTVSARPSLPTSSCSHTHHTMRFGHTTQALAKCMVSTTESQNAPSDLASALPSSSKILVTRWDWAAGSI